MQLILASASPRRAELLTAAGYVFAIAPAEVDESQLPGEAPGVYARRVARDKAAAASQGHPGSTILAADTVVVAGAEILGKPASPSEASRMLTQLSGAVHIVQTAVVVRRAGHEATDVVQTRVHFRPLDPDEIAWYVATGEPDGKAGAYAIQGRAARFIDWIEGSWSNVVGLPVATVYRMLREAGLT
jgi:septum formation protein